MITSSLLASIPSLRGLILTMPDRYTSEMIQLASLPREEFNKLWSEVQAEETRKVYVISRSCLYDSMCQAVKYKCEHCGVEKGQRLPDPPNDGLLSEHLRVVRCGARAALTLYFIGRADDWTPVNIKVLCNACYQEAEQQRHSTKRSMVVKDQLSVTNEDARPKRGKTQAQIAKDAAAKASKAEQKRQSELRKLQAWNTGKGR